jgi:hypothetical protein
VLDEEPDDDLDAHESELHAELEIALVEAPDHVTVGAVLARANAAREEGLLSKKAFGELLAASGQDEFWNKFLL